MLNSMHPLIPNANEYMFEKKYISIHSEDRDLQKYPNSADFEIELPQDYCNVQAVKLASWSFPDADVFSQSKNNTTISFSIVAPYNPSSLPGATPLQVAIFSALFSKTSKYFVKIESGTYSPSQIQTELTNKFNAAVSDYIRAYLLANNPSLVASFTGYTEFVIAYNMVSNKIWFGNKCDNFIVYSESDMNKYLGFSLVPISMTSATSSNFFYETPTSWLSPSYSNASVYFSEGLFKANLKGSNAYYMEIFGMNNIDETCLYSELPKTSPHTNFTTGSVNSCFAKIPIQTNTTAYFPADTLKLYNPPAVKIRNIKFKIRHHNGTLVDFSGENYSFMLEMFLYRPQTQTSLKMFRPESYSSCS